MCIYYITYIFALKVKCKYIGKFSEFKRVIFFVFILHMYITPRIVKVFENAMNKYEGKFVEHNSQWKTKTMHMWLRDILLKYIYIIYISVTSPCSSSIMLAVVCIFQIQLYVKLIDFLDYVYYIVFD